MTALVLRHYALADESAALAAHAELAAEDFEFLLGYDPQRGWADFVQMTLDNEIGVNLPPTYVPAAQLCAQVNGDLVGRASIRYGFNDFLAFRGGHIGYAVRPQFRRRGCATQILRLSLEHIRAQGVERVLVTCDDGNLGSAAVIEAIGRDRLGLQFDLYHVQITEGDISKRMEKHMPIISHMQIADVPARNEPGTGEIGWAYLFRRMDELGYTGWVGCEYRPAGDTVAGLGWRERFAA